MNKVMEFIVGLATKILPAPKAKKGHDFLNSSNEE